MDVFVVLNLGVQVVIAMVSWVTASVFGNLSNHTAATINFITFVALLLTVVFGTLWLLLVPYVREICSKRTDWPAALGREVPEIRYFPFSHFVNVFPQWQQGRSDAPKVPRHSQQRLAA